MDENKLYAFWKYDRPPYVLGGEVKELDKEGCVTTVNFGPRMRFRPLKIVPLEKGIKLQKKIDKAYAKYKRIVNEAETALKTVVKDVTE